MLTLSFIFVYFLVSGSSGSTIIDTFAYFVSVETNKNITVDTESVVTSSRASTILKCLTSEIILPEQSIKYVYFEKSSGICYFINSTNYIVSSNITTSSTYLYQLGIHYQEEGITVQEGNYTSCQDVYDDGFGSAGVYKMELPIGILSSNYVYCNEGWIVFQRRQDGSVDFYRGWDDYVNGFGNIEGEFWLGLETIHQLTSLGNCELYIYLEAGDDHPIQTEGYALYSQFMVDGLSSNYRLTVSGYNGTAADSFSYQGGNEFTTFDRDNDKNGQNCAQIYKGGWWYQNCHVSNLNGLYLNGDHDSNADGINWLYPWSHFYSLIKVEMRLRCP